MTGIPVRTADHLHALRALPAVAQRSLAFGLLVIALMLIYWLCATAIPGALHSQSAWRAETQNRLAQARGRIAQEKHVAEWRQQVSASPAWQWLWEPESEVLSAAALQALIRIAGQQAGVNSVTVASAPADRRGPIRRIRATATTSLDSAQLQAWLRALSDAPHYVRVERIQLHTSEQQRPDENPMLLVTLDVVGYQRANSAPPNPDPSPENRSGI